MKLLEESERPWGKYKKFYQENGVWIKRVEVNPKGRLSLQKHQFRSEKWIVVHGQDDGSKWSSWTCNARPT